VPTRSSLWSNVNLGMHQISTFFGCAVYFAINYMLCAHAQMMTASKCLSTVRNTPSRPMIICALPAVSHVNAHPQTFGPTKKYCFSSHLYLRVRLLAYYFRRQVYVFDQ